MSSLTNINNNSSVVNVGRTTPVSPGAQPAAGSIPVVVATDQSPIPVVEQNKIQSEVALSLLGIPRAEVALGIFADVNTYDVNPTEWSSSPQVWTSGNGIKHLPEEAGALVESPRNSSAILTSKRFFRYQPGRVSAATFGIKSTVSEAGFAQNPVIRKYGIFDKFDGYYWETQQNGEDDNFSVTRRTQSLYKAPASPFGVVGQDLRKPTGSTSSGQITVDQTDDYRYIGVPPETAPVVRTTFIKERQNIRNQRYALIDAALTAAAIDYAALATAIGGGETAASVEEKCRRDLDYWIDMYLWDLEWGGDAHTALNTRNYETAVLANTSTEIAAHTALKDELVGAGGLYPSGTDVYSRLNTLTSIPITFFGQADPQNNPIAPTSYGAKSQLDTIFDARGHYWAYYVSTKTEAGATITYSPYTTSTGRTFTAEEVKLKCQRDVGYIIQGYKDDLVGGGNGATKYNASMYYKGSGLSIGSQGGADTVEKERHEHLQALITAELTAFSLSTTRFTQLSNIIINNFLIEDINDTEYGSRAVAGNLVALRDGLIMVHAAVNDPSLLREAKRIVAVCDATDNTVQIVDEVVTYGQHVKYFGTTNGDLVDGKMYKVYSIENPKGNKFTLVNESGVAINISNTTITGSTGFIQTVNPFILPKGVVSAGTVVSEGYDPAVYQTRNDFLVTKGYSAQNDPFPVGMMFPYMYTDTGVLPKSGDAISVGYIDTALDTSVADGINDMRTQIDAVNFIPEYINWIKNNVDPEYYGVYEYRIPRSRFSTDKLNGQENPVVYSDIAVGSSGKVRPGQSVLDEGGNQLVDASVYDFDFTKVTMLKIEFSWYGAVGALFLAYVPVGNGEARWVRVHHLRASNQLKIPSLGNATLPITYNVYGGGDSLSLGDGETGANYGYGRDSHHIVKYGASYYIDGGDRGTVRLYSHTNDDSISAYGKNFSLGAQTITAANDAIDLPYITVTPATAGVDDNVFFLDAKVKTGNPVDQNITVQWVDGNKIYLSATPSNNTITLIPDRSNYTYGVETKREIVSSLGQRVRNRVQVYPTKLSTANLGTVPVRLRMKKTPVFQSLFVEDAVATFATNASYTITGTNTALPISAGVADYMEDGDSAFGWFRVEVDNEKSTAFGRLYRSANDYYFELRESFNGTVVIPAGNFLRDKRFTADGTIITGTSKTTFEKEGISSVVIANDIQVPIPGTGLPVATIYLRPGSEQLDLSSFFDYNKEYLSFPLTDETETLYLAIDTEEAAGNTTPVSIGITWEEQ